MQHLEFAINVARHTPIDEIPEDGIVGMLLGGQRVNGNVMEVHHQHLGTMEAFPQFGSQTHKWLWSLF